MHLSCPHASLCAPRMSLHELAESGAYRMAPCTHKYEEYIPSRHARAIKDQKGSLFTSLAASARDAVRLDRSPSRPGPRSFLRFFLVPPCCTPSLGAGRLAATFSKKFTRFAIFCCSRRVTAASLSCSASAAAPSCKYAVCLRGGCMLTVYYF